MALVCGGQGSAMWKNFLSYKSMQEFLRTEKWIEKHEAQPSASHSCQVFLEITKWLI